MSKLEVDAIEPQSGTTITIGSSGDTVNLVGTLNSNGSPLPGDISSVVAGTGLSGGGTTGAVTLNIEAAQPTITSTGTLTGFTSTGIDDNASGTSLTIASDGRTTLDATNEKSFVVHHSDGSNVRIGMNNDTTNSNEIAYEGTDFVIKPGGTEKARLTTTGLGIGTSSPEVPLSVLGSDTQIHFNETSASGGGYLMSESAGQFRISGGAGYKVGGSGWVAKSTEAVIIGHDSGGDIKFFSNTGLTAGNTFTPSERMRIDSSGNVAIATTSAVAPLTVASGSDTGAISLGGDVSSSGITNNTRKIGRLVVPSYATAEEPVGIILADFNGTDNQIAIGGGSSSVNSATKILFLTGANATTASGTEAMRINSSGNVLIGASSAQRLDREKVEIKNTTGEGLLTLTNDISFAGRVHKSLQTSNGTHYIDYYLSAGNSNVGSITHNDSSTSFVTSSDYRLKENVVDMTNATDRLKQLQPKRFNFKVDADKTVDGFIAHEVSSVVPEAISGTHNEVEVWRDGEELPDGVSIGDNKLDDNGNTIPKYQGIDQSKLVPLLVKTIQELEARITTLENA